MSIQMNSLKKGEIYAAGEEFNYVFQVMKDGDNHLLYRSGSSKPQDTVDAKSLVVDTTIRDRIREATDNEKLYLKACIETNEYIDPTEFMKLQSTPNYQIF